MSERRPRRWPRRLAVGAGVVVLLAGVGLVYAWQRGWFTDAYRAATRPCPADLEATMPTTQPDAPLAALVPVAADLAKPTALAFHPDDALELTYLAERAGTVRVLEGDDLQPAPVLDLVGRVSTEFDQGLLGLAVEPDASHLWGYFTAEEGASTLVAWELDEAGAPDADSEVVVLAEEQPDVYHNGGGLVFGPDGRLYLTMGDGGLLGDPTDNGQDPDALLGKVLAFEVDDGPEAASPTVFALGVRNPFRLAFDPATGDLWLGDVGHNCMEEVDRIPAGVEGANLGWNRFEGPLAFVGGDDEGLVPPVWWYPHDPGCAVIGGAVHRGGEVAAVPALDGRYVFGDYCTGRLTALELDGDGEVVQASDVGVGVNQVLAVVEDPRGRLWVTTEGGRVERLVAPDDPAAAVRTDDG